MFIKPLNRIGLLRSETFLLAGNRLENLGAIAGKPVVFLGDRLTPCVLPGGVARLQHYIKLPNILQMLD
ncbi:MAG TPA: hypothetical protein ENN42_09930 [Thioalkalivibrio sp.]|nr:hypothetical protein [Thioalkalivibrio sp.]